jgi:hypothetical protein
MQGKEADNSQETGDKSRATGNFQKQFTEQIEIWKKEGCQVPVRDGEAVRPCGATPHRVKQGKPNEKGMVPLLIDCTAGHAESWKFMVDQEQMKRDAEDQAAAMAKAAEAKVTITFNMKTQAIGIDPLVPNPGIGLMMLAYAQKFFFDQVSQEEEKRKSGLFTPDRRLLDRNGKILN